MNETSTSTEAATIPADVAARQLTHVGAAYGLIFLLVVAFAWRTTQATKRLSERVDELERDRHR